MILIGRHGESENNALGIIGGDSKLTRNGALQAYNLAQKVKDLRYQVKYVFFGPSIRGGETAEIVAQELGAQFILVPSIVERKHGVLEGEHFSRIPELAMDYVKLQDGKTYILEVQGGENYRNLHRRAEIVLNQIQTLKLILCEDKYDVLVVGHAALNKAMIAVSKGLPWDSLSRTVSMANTDLFTLRL